MDEHVLVYADEKVGWAKRLIWEIKMTNWKIRPTLKTLHKMYMNVHVLIDADEKGDWTKCLI